MRNGSWLVLGFLEMIGCVDAEQGKATGQHRPGGFGEGEPGTVGGRGFLLTQGQHGGKPRQYGIGDGDEMPGEPVGRTVGGGAEKNAGVVGEGLVQRRRVDGPRLGPEPHICGITHNRPAPGMRVPHPEQWIALTLHQMLVPDPGPVVGRGMQQGPAGGVPTEGTGIGGRGNGPDADVDVRVGDAVDPYAQDTPPLGLERPRALGAHEGTLRPEKPSDDIKMNNGTHFTGRDQPYDTLPGKRVTVPVPAPAPQHLTHDLDGRGTPEGDVDEPGPGDHDVADPAGAEQTLPQHFGDAVRRLSGRAGELEGDVGGVVPAPPGPRRRDDDPLGRSHVQFPLVDGTAHREQHGAGELDGGHGTSVGEEGGG
ncbi:hypothetical protein GCM10010297_05720 [Streptomyces malachitofuscus]|nr:hypothetical protein GCM10010297_05720 [Streptomyces malachitofuscus]